MILYTLYQNSYRDVCHVADEDNKIHEKFYINLTNKCPCSCTFCLRQTKKMLEEHTLWLKSDVQLEEVIQELEKYDLSDVPEIIFCGFGEPTENLEVLLSCAKYLKSRNEKIVIRINTNGLGNLVHNKDITPLFKDVIDVVSISLNASNKEEYLRLTRSKFGIPSFDAMLEFAKLAKSHVSKVILSVVDIIGEEEIRKCREITDNLGVTLRVREFEE